VRGVDHPLHLAPRLRMSRAILLLPLFAPYGILCGDFYLYLKRFYYPSIGLKLVETQRQNLTFRSVAEISMDGPSILHKIPTDDPSTDSLAPSSNTMKSHFY
jgi:hypothetical protein